MPTEVMQRTSHGIPFVVLLFVTGCGGAPDEQRADATPPAAASSISAEPSGPVPDACTFFTRAELEANVGWELRDGEKEDAPPGLSSCDFEMPPQMSITRTFPNPPLPRSVDFSSLVINTHPADAAVFASARQQLGAAVEEVSGVGDAAYFNGPNQLHVRVGNRGFSLRIYTNASTAADLAKVREVMLTLGRLGASKLSGGTV